MLRNVLENYIDTISEREFDVPFLGLLFNNGFYDIHYLHGAFEFGKDFIAKKEIDGQQIQFVFQSKAGDIGVTEWRELRYQIDEMRTNYAAHPNYDNKLPLAAVAVTTGRLVGGASISAQEYNEYLLKRGEVGFEVWDKDKLIEMITATDPTICNLSQGARFLQLIAVLRQKEGTFKEIENYSRQWVDNCKATPDYKTSLGVIMEASLICHELLKIRRNTLACYTTLMALRATMAGIHTLQSFPNWADDVIRLIEDQFIYSASLIKQSVETLMPTPRFYEMRKGGIGIVEYPVLCHQTIEILGLLGLLKCLRGDLADARSTMDLMRVVISENPGFLHPISDKYAISLLIPILLVAKLGDIGLCEEILRKVCKWLCDRYEQSEAGLAGPHATEQEEIRRLLGYAYTFVTNSNRRESYIVTVILDISLLLNMPQVYSDVLNDILAVRICPSLVFMQDNQDQYIIQGNTPHCPNITYPEDLKNGQVPKHHMQPTGLFTQQGHLWAGIVLYSVLRDRYRISELKEVLKLTI